MTTRPDARWNLRKVLKERVGGFFNNTVHTTETCRTCAAPTDANTLCHKCGEHVDEFGIRLADHISILTYARGWTPGGIPHQSAHTVRAYKQSPPAPKCADDLALMVLAATFIHGKCMQRAIGQPWTAITFVPSVNHPGPDHPVVELARQVVCTSAQENRFMLDLGPGAGDTARTVRPDRFIVPDRFRRNVADQHVIVVDDTWTSGAKMQSAAVTLHDAGAASVTGLCVDRWCDYRIPSHKRLLDSCTLPYDAFVCPVTGDNCM